jgi:hypothetical protein
MTDWTTLTEAQTDPNSPLTAEKVKALRDNPIAMAEGAANAPRYAHCMSVQKSSSSGDELEWNNLGSFSGFELEFWWQSDANNANSQLSFYDGSYGAPVTIISTVIEGDIHYGKLYLDAIASPGTIKGYTLTFPSASDADVSTRYINPESFNSSGMKLVDTTSTDLTTAITQIKLGFNPTNVAGYYTAILKGTGGEAAVIPGVV